MDRPVVLGGDPIGRLPAVRWPIGGEAELERVRAVLAADTWSDDGELTREFERRFCELQTSSHGWCVANGTVAIQLALEALDVGVGDEVIVPGLTWQATAAAVLDVNAVPVLVDVEPDTYCIDPKNVEAAITTRTKGIIVVHLYDALADMDRILDLARRHGVWVIEDCAHGHGASWRGHGVGSLGAAGTFSFQTTKTLTAGEGGFVTAGDPAIAERLYSLRTCGRRRDGSPDEHWRPIQSGNYRLSVWQAAILLAQLDRFPAQFERRQASLRYLDGVLSVLPGIRTTRRRAEVTGQSVYCYVFRYDEAEWDGLPGWAFRAALEAELGRAIRLPYEPLNGCSLYQPHTKRRHALSEGYLRQIDPTRFELPVTERAYRSEGVCLPQEWLLLPDAELALIPWAIDRLRSHLPSLLPWAHAGEEAPMPMLT